MTHIVSITSQGQISIPAKIRRDLGLDKHKKAFIKLEDKRIVIEPIRDFLELKGSLHDKAIKGKSIQEVIKMEKAAVAQAIVERYKKKSGL